MRLASKLLLATGLAGFAAVTVLATAAPTSPPKAQPQWYAVEVLVFRYTGPHAAQGVVWPRKVPAPSLAGAIYPPASKTNAYVPLQSTATVMRQAWQRLTASEGYVPLLQTGWMQPGLNTDSARPISLHPLPHAATAPMAMTSPAGPATTLSAPGTIGTPTAGSAAMPARVEGTATFVVSDNKPYVKLNLRLCEPPPAGITLQAPSAATAPETALAAMTTMTAASLSLPAPATADNPTTSSMAQRQCFALQESRQVKPGQLEYFDTAAFGVLALVNPVKTPATKATALPATRKPG